MRTIRLLLPLLGLLMLSSCSDPKADYDNVQKIQDASELTIQRTSDYDIKAKACDDAINALQTFLAKHADGEWANTAKTALDSWQSRKSSLHQEFTSLSEKLYQLMSVDAALAASKHHLGSKIEKIQLSDRKSSIEGQKIVVNDVYLVKMRGQIIGRNVFNFMVKVSGHISTDTKTVAVDNSAIEE